MELLIEDEGLILTLELGLTEDDGETVSSVVGSQDPQQQLDDWTSQDPDPTSQYDYSQPQDRGNIGRYTHKLIHTVI